MSDAARVRRVIVTSVPLMLATVDVAWVLAVAAAVSAPRLENVRELLEASALIAVCVVLPAFAMGLYDQRHLRSGKLLLGVLLSLVLTAAALSVLATLELRHLPHSPGEILTITLASTLSLLPARALWCKLVETPLLRRRIAVFGSAKDISVIRHIQATSSRSALSCEATLQEPPSRKGPLFDRRVDEVVVSDEEVYFADRGLLAQRFSGTRVTGLSDFVERECRVIDVLGTDARRAVLWPKRPVGSRIVKRTLDILASVLIFAFALPVLVATACAVWLVDRGPIIYRQTRIGLGGKPFVLLKFRTMRVDAEADGIARWAEKRDLRVTRIGGFLRLVRIDELPQLWNIIRGDMSLVGPRPERPAFVQQITEQAPGYDGRHLVPPGVTGWAQISFPYGASIAQNITKAGYDLYYVKNGNTFLDVMILLKTIRVILLAEGSR